MPEKKPVRIRGGRANIPAHAYPPIDQPEYFVHAPKVAGMAICTTLGIRRTHDPASYIKEAIGQRWGCGKIFGSIRNPWDRALSWFMYNSAFRKNYAQTKTDFNRWIAEGMDQDWTGGRGARLLHQEDFIEIDGESVLGFTIHFEDLYDDWLHLMGWLNRPYVALKTNDRIPPEGKPDYREWYTNDSRKFAEDKFAYFAEKYGYTFGDESFHVKMARLIKLPKEGVTDNEVQREGL